MKKNLLVVFLGNQASFVLNNFSKFIKFVVKFLFGSSID
jgi:hypothetical protein